MQGVGLAKTAIFVQLHPVRGILFVFGGHLHLPFGQIRSGVMNLKKVFAWGLTLAVAAVAVPPLIREVRPTPVIGKMKI